MNLGKQQQPLSQAETTHVQLPIIRPALPSLDEIRAALEASWSKGIVTVGPLVREFEAEVCAQTHAAYAVAFSSCTAGLMLIPPALALARGGEVIVPSFTFAATAQALAWNGLVPVFCDCLPGTKALDPEDVRRNITSKTVAICPVYIYGLPPDVEPLLDIGEKEGIPVYFDSAQGMGSTYQDKPAGAFGVCEAFSFSPTKVVTAIEGGVVTTNDGTIAERLRSMRDYGKDLQYGEEMVLMGLSARMSEMHAAVGLASMRNSKQLVTERMSRIATYRQRLGSLPGCSVQEFPNNRASSGNYFVLFVSPNARASRDELHQALKSAGIQTKRYFYPALHLHKVFASYPHRVSAKLENSLTAAAQGLALPLFSNMTDEQLDTVCRNVESLMK